MVFDGFKLYNFDGYYFVGVVISGFVDGGGVAFADFVGEGK